MVCHKSELLDRHSLVLEHMGGNKRALVPLAQQEHPGLD